MKKIIALSIVLICIMGTTAMAASELVKTGVVNVARGKPVSVSNLNTAGKTADKLTDANKETGNIVFSNGGEQTYFQIDLKNRYVPEKITLHLGYGMGQWYNSMKNFQIIGSNNESFSESFVLYDAENKDLRPTDWGTAEQPPQWSFDVVPTNMKSVRYIRILKTDNVGCGYTEIEVFASQTVTDVARNKTVTASSTANGYSAQGIVNGLNAAAADVWHAGYVTDGVFKYIMVDLESVFPIELIELEGAYNRGNIAERIRWDLYASKTGFNAVLNSTVSHLDYNTYDYLDYITASTANPELIIPAWNAVPNYRTVYACGGKYNTNTINQETPKVASNNEYQYIMLRHWQANEAASLGNLRAYAVNPTLNIIEVADDKVTLSFNHKIDAATLEAASVTNDMGEPVSVSYTQIDDCTYSFNIAQTETNDIYNIDLTSVTDMYGLKTESGKVEFQIDGKTYWEVEDFQFKSNNTKLEATLENTSVDTTANVWLVAAFYKSNGEMYKVLETKQPVAAGATATISIDIPTDDQWSTICGYLWSSDVVTKVYNNYIKINK